ncbi:MAG: translation initiation factor IF-2 [Candidatus Borkfalkiaceae bacterium]|nr:translation initiation factor IF-2 [Christensenellaceae bacterium]
MEERQDNTKNIKALGQILKEGNLDKLLEQIKQSQAKAGLVMKKLGEKQAEFEAAQRAAELSDAEVAEKEAGADISAGMPLDEKAEEVKPAKKSRKKVESESTEVIVGDIKAEKPAENVDEVKAETIEKTKEVKPAKKSLKKAESENAEISVEAEKTAPSKVKTEKFEKVEKTEKTVKAEETTAEKAAVSDKKATAKVDESVRAEKPEAKQTEKTEEVKAEETKAAEKPAEPPKKSILSFIVKKADPTKPQREYTPDGKRIFKNERGERPAGAAGQRPPRGDRPYNPAGSGTTGTGRPFGQKPFGTGTGFGAKPGSGARRPQEIEFIPPKDNKPVKKKNDKYEEKRNPLSPLNKRAHIKELTVADFDENKTGYRKLRKPKTQKKEEQANYIKIEKAVLTKELTPIKELSEKFGISAVEISKRLFKEGISKTINDSLDYDTAAFLAADLGIEVELKLEKSAEELMNEGFNEEKDDESLLVKRPPIVTVMGHVDHGKTSLLDKIRSANVADGEAGGITQHIGAYSVDVNGNKITFIDTPGHAAFTSMRARGAQVTDIAIIVVAADDGIMPQTIEAINHAKAAGVSIIVAANKIDKPHVDLDRLRNQLSEQGLLVEDWGGDVMMIPVSAKTGAGIDKLLESVLLIAEMRELKANPARKARGTVIEAKLDKGKGPMATVLVQNGTLRTGDNVVAGTVVGRVRAMINDKGANVKEAGPSVAVSILGLEEVPNAGDAIFAVDQEKLSKLVAQERKNKERDMMIRQQSKVSLDDLFSKISEGELKNLNIIIKADVQGSAEAVKQSLTELSTDEVKVNVLHAAVGAINETDVMLADSANAVIIGFNVRPDAKAKTLAERSHIDIKLYRIIYEAIEDVKKAMKGMLAPKFSDQYTGKAEVRDTFKITGVGTVAGCYVTDGKIVRQAKLRIYRNDVMICEGNVMQLKRFKDEVKEVAQGYECGISIEGFNDIKVGDFIESYIVVENKD